MPGNFRVQELQIKVLTLQHVPLLHPKDLWHYQEKSTKCNKQINPSPIISKRHKLMIPKLCLYLHSMADLFTVCQNFTEIFGAKEISQCCLCKQTSWLISLFHISDWHGWVTDAEVNNCIHCNSHTVFGQNLKANVDTWLLSKLTALSLYTTLQTTNHTT